MPEPLKSNPNSETAADFIEAQIERTRNNLRCAIQELGPVVLASANPVRWIRRYPVKCGIATSLLIAASAAGVVLALRRKKNRDASGPANPVNVYLKNPQNSHHWRFQLASALLAGVAGKLSQGIKARFIESLTEHRAPTRSQTVIVPNPKLRDVEI